MVVIDKSCTGCTACLNICPKQAITMKNNEEGFLYPLIDKDYCIECGLCDRVCPIISKPQVMPPISILAAKTREIEIRRRSTSGGMFSALAEWTIDKGGWVYGASLDNEMHVIHKGTNSYEGIDAFRGSKYTQSNLSNIFVDIFDKLKTNCWVLFTGTPCQCGGLIKYLECKRANTSRLALCDIVCHGVPSPSLWMDHMNTLKKKHGDILDYRCRSKVNGWHNHIEYCRWKNGRIEYGTRFVQKQKNMFYTNLGLRNSCAECQYTSTERVSDLTIADYWGIENSYPQFDDNDGVSLVLVNTDKGKGIISELNQKIECIETSLASCLVRQPNLQHPTPVNLAKRAEFWEDYNSKGYLYCCRKYTEYGIKNWMKKQIGRVEKKIKRILKRRCI